MAKPFVKLFFICSNYYVYDIYTNTVLKVEKNIFDEISKCIKYGSENCDSNIINNIQKDGYLQKKKTIHVSHILTDVCEDYLNSLVSNPILQVTQNCNFRCLYCNYSGSGKFDRQHNVKHMTWETAQKSLEFCFLRSSYSSNFNLSFYGGEPLLEYKLINKCIEYTNKRMLGKNIKYNMTTNFSIINDEIIEMLIKNNIYITISIDGNEDTHDKNRKLANDGSGTHKIVMQNLNFLREKYLDYYLKCVQINCVWDLENSYDELLEFFTNEVFNGVRVNITPVDNKRTENSYVLTQNNIKQNYRCATTSILKGIGLYKNKVNGDVQWWYKYNLFNRKLFYIKEMPSFYHHNGPCLPGYKRLFINTDGAFLPCEKVSNLSNALCFGNVFDGFNFEKVKELLNIGKLTEYECQNCWAIHFCDICPAHV